MASRIGAIAGAVAAGVKARGLSRSVEVLDRARWSRDEASSWQRRTPRLFGCNFAPSTAGNQLEVWQAETFDPVTIDRELGWAATLLGMNSIRLYLHDLAWQVDPTGFLQRLDEVLGIAASHGISVMPVLFDGIWDPEPRPGLQRSPRPGIHNSTWVQSPGAAVLSDRSRWAGLGDYVAAVMGRFGTDDRVVVWDLFNEPDSFNPAYAHRDAAHKRRLTAELLEQVWDWAVEANPDQPLTVGVYEQVQHHPERASRVARIAIERSDVISFHCYQGEAVLHQAIRRLGRYERPVICTEWLGRPVSPVRLARLFAAEEVGAYAWGLVDGRTQTKFSWTSWYRRDRATRGWFHELLHPDGTPYDEQEASVMRGASPRTDLRSPP